MNNKINFFDQLDGNWGDVIADTYRNASSIVYTDKKAQNNVNISLSNENPDNKSVYANQNTYTETYIADDDKHKIKFIVKIDENFSAELNIFVELHNPTIELDRGKEYLQSFVVIRRDEYNSKGYKFLTQHDDVSVKHEFVFNIIDIAREKLDLDLDECNQIKEILKNSTHKI